MTPIDQSNLKIAFFGTPRFAQIVLERLINSPYKPSVVITAPDTKSGRGRQIKPSPVKQSAEKNGIKVLELTSFNQQSSINNQQFDLAILVAFGKILPQEILDIPKYGFINVHPSLLPKYRGPSPIQSAILAEEGKTGVSIMLLDEKVDHGPIIAQKEISIDKEDTHDTLVEKLANDGVRLLLKSLPDYLKGILDPKPQNHTKATFTKHIQKKDGAISLQNPPDPKTINRMIYAFYPWPTVWAKLDGKIIKFLPGGKIQPEGKKPMTKKEFLNGYPKSKELIENLF